MKRAATSVQEDAPYQLFMLALSAFVLLQLAVETILTLDEDALTVLLWADTAICSVFLFDFFRSLRRASNRRRYFLTWGWIDLLSSIPAVPFLLWGRAARMVRLVRILRAARSGRILASFLIERRAETTMLGVALLALLGTVAASITVLQVEGPAGGNIVTGSDALWWSLVTVTSVGYGDMFPVTAVGRLVATVLMTIGIMLFGTMTAYLAAWFMKPGDTAQDAVIATIRSDVAEIRAMLEAVAGPGSSGPASAGSGSSGADRTHGGAGAERRDRARGGGPPPGATGA